MSKKLKYLLTLSVYVILMLADGFLTFINTPDLSMEANPLVLYLGLGWGALFIANLLGFIFFAWITWYTFIKYETVYTDETKITHYVSQLYYERPDKFAWVLYKFPKNWKPLIACAGYGFAWGLILGRLWIVMEWIGFTLRVDMATYAWISNRFFFGRVSIFVCIIVCLIAAIMWHYLEFKKQKKKAL